MSTTKKKYVRQRGLLKDQPLSLEDTYNAQQQCPICHSAVKRKRILSVQQQPTVDYLACSNCYGHSTSLMPTTELLAKNYTGFYDDYEEAFTFDNPHRFAQHILQYVSLMPAPTPIKILDFGGGDGTLAITIAEHLLKQYPKQQIEVWLVDFHPMEDTQKGNITFYAKKYLTEIPPETHFDCIIASAILEHIPDLHTTFQQLFKLAAKGSYFYARTPYRLPFKKWIPALTMEYPGHVHDLGDSFWSRLPETFQLNAKVIASRPSLVQYEFKRSFFLALAAYIAKFPAHIELFFNPQKKDLSWTYVAGWEVFLQFED